MNDIGAFWRAYARLQDRTRCHARTDAFGWGLEDGLNELLDSVDLNDIVNLTEKSQAAIARGKARERYRRRLRQRYLDPREVDDPFARLLDRAHLREVLDRVQADDVTIIVGMGMGDDSKSLSAQLSIRPDTTRKRIDRLRLKLAA